MIPGTSYYIGEEHRMRLVYDDGNGTDVGTMPIIDNTASTITESMMTGLVADSPVFPEPKPVFYRPSNTRCRPVIRAQYPLHIRARSNL